MVPSAANGTRSLLHLVTGLGAVLDDERVTATTTPPNKHPHAPPSTSQKDQLRLKSSQRLSFLKPNVSMPAASSPKHPEREILDKFSHFEYFFLKIYPAASPLNISSCTTFMTTQTFFAVVYGIIIFIDIRKCQSFIIHLFVLSKRSQKSF